MKDIKNGIFSVSHFGTLGCILILSAGCSRFTAQSVSPVNLSMSTNQMDSISTEADQVMTGPNQTSAQLTQSLAELQQLLQEVQAENTTGQSVSATQEQQALLQLLNADIAQLQATLSAVDPSATPTATPTPPPGVSDPTVPPAPSPTSTPPANGNPSYLANTWTPIPESSYLAMSKLEFPFIYPSGDESSVRVLGNYLVVIVEARDANNNPYPVGATYNMTTGVWANMNMTDYPVNNAPYGYNAGSKYIVWGVATTTTGIARTISGAIYDPAANMWTTMSTKGAPNSGEPVWMGDKLYVFSDTTPTDNAAYDPSTNAWISLPAMSGFGPFWTGSEILYYNGYVGSLYNPATNTATPISTVGAPSLIESVIYWTGNKLVVWGGGAGAGSNSKNTGAVFDPATNTWAPMSTVGAPAGLTSQNAYALSGTGDKVFMMAYSPSTALPGYGLVSGGKNFVYDVAANTWTAMPANPENFPNNYFENYWNGSQLLLWTSSVTGPETYFGFIYNPSTNTWSQASVAGIPPNPNETTQSFSWTGTDLVTWIDNQGAVYNLATNTWTAMSLPPSSATAGNLPYVGLTANGGFYVFGGMGLSTADQNVFTGGIFTLP